MDFRRHQIKIDGLVFTFFHSHPCAKYVKLKQMKSIA